MNIGRSRTSEKYIQIEINEFKVETKAAILVNCPNPVLSSVIKTVDIWFPLSQVSEIHKEPAGEDGSYLLVSRWIATQKGFI